MVEFNTIFGKLELKSPYLWLQGTSSKPLIDEMKITHQGRSQAVNRALSDFGIEDSFARAAIRFKEHYHYDIGSSATARSTKNTAQQAMEYMENKLSNLDLDPDFSRLISTPLFMQSQALNFRRRGVNVGHHDSSNTQYYHNIIRNSTKK